MQTFCHHFESNRVFKSVYKFLKVQQNNFSSHRTQIYFSRFVYTANSWFSTSLSRKKQKQTDERDWIRLKNPAALSIKNKIHGKQTAEQTSLSGQRGSFLWVY